MTRFFLYLILVLLPVPALSQGAPSLLKELFPTDQVGGTITVLKSVTPEQREMLLGGMNVTPQGYLKGERSSAYVHLIDDFFRRARTAQEAPQIRQYRLTRSVPLRANIIFAGVVVEDPARVDYLFTIGSDRAMLTIWDMRASGARSVVPEEFFNSAVLGSRAVLTLIGAPGVSDGIWKLIWWKDGMSFEYYLTDKLAAGGHPTRRPEEVTTLAAEIVQAAVKSNNRLH